MVRTLAINVVHSSYVLVCSMKFTAFRAKIIIVGGLFGALLAILLTTMFEVGPVLKIIVYISSIYSGMIGGYNFLNAKEIKVGEFGEFTKESRPVYIVLSSVMTMAAIYVLLFMDHSGIIVVGVLFFLAATVFCIWNKND